MRSLLRFVAAALLWGGSARLIASAAINGYNPPDTYDPTADVDGRQAYARIQAGFSDLEKNAPPSPQEAALGRELFFDPRMSPGGAMSCATCHRPDKAYTDGLPRARGRDGRELPRNTPSLYNSVRNIPHNFFWDGRADTLEQAILTALESRVEMNRDPREVAASLRRIPGYTRQFIDLYGADGMTPQNLAHALAAFIRRDIRVGPTAFDRFPSDPASMTPDQIEGMRLFVGKARCLQCHAGPFLSDDSFRDNGLKPDPAVDDAGRYAVDHDPRNWRAFKTPPLRDVALTAPYMHDGSLKTLRDVVDFYDRGGDDPLHDERIRPLHLTGPEKKDLVAFLNALTGEQKPVTAPPLPAAIGPQTLAESDAWDDAKIRAMRSELDTSDIRSLAHDAGALRDYTAYLREMAKELFPGAKGAPSCLRSLQGASGRLAAMAEAGRPLGSLRTQWLALDAAQSQCAGFEPAPGRPQGMGAPKKE